MSGISPEVRQEIAEIFCMLSDTGDIQGYLPGPKLALAASTLDLTLKPTVLSFYKGEKGKSKSSDLNFDTFLSLLSASIVQDPAYLDKDVEESFNYFDPSNMGVCEAGEMHRWLNLLGEHIDLPEVERQMVGSEEEKEGGKEEDSNNGGGSSEGMNLQKYAAMISTAPLPSNDGL